MVLRLTVLLLFLIWFFLANYHESHCMLTSVEKFITWKTLLLFCCPKFSLTKCKYCMVRPEPFFFFNWACQQKWKRASNNGDFSSFFLCKQSAFVDFSERRDISLLCSSATSPLGICDYAKTDIYALSKRTFQTQSNFRLKKNVQFAISFLERKKKSYERIESHDFMESFMLIV